MIVGKIMFQINDSIVNLKEDDIADNLLYYKYNINHLLSLIQKNVAQDDTRYISAYRSFEGEVFENYMYEKLLIYAQKEPKIEKFLLKGHHQNRKYNHANTLSISEHSQIIYRTKTREINEFDAMMFTKNKLYFVEITLVKSVAKLKKRLRKKKALLEAIFPDYEIKALIVLNEGVMGVKQLPKYCTVWITKQFCAKNILAHLIDKKQQPKQPKHCFTDKKFVEVYRLKIFPFRYYNVLFWLTKMIRSKQSCLIDINFLLEIKTQRYHDLFGKIYLGYMKSLEFQKLYNFDLKDDQDIIVALEKKHDNSFVISYYIQYSRKKLDYISFNKENIIQIEKKDPYGITVTEVYHITKMINSTYLLNQNDISSILTLL